MEIINPGKTDIWNDQAADILQEAFQKEFVKLLGKGENYSKAVKCIVNYNNCYLYKEENDVLGIVVLAAANSSPFILDISRFRKEYSFWKSLRIWFFLNLIQLTSKSAPGTLKIKMLAVNGSHRGKGIGSRLLEMAEVLATEKGYSKLQLEVVDTNPRAKKLYERMGYASVKSVKTGFLTRSSGYTGFDVMLKNL